MTFTTRDWIDGELVTAAKMEDLEARLAAYTDLIGGGGGSGPFTVIRTTGGNDTGLFTAAISALPATGGVIVCPDANYKITSISIPAAPKTVTIIGSGIGQTTLQQNASTVSALTQQIDVAATGTVRLRDMTLQGPTAVTGANIFNLVHGNDGVGGLIDLENVRLYKFGYGIWTEDQHVRCKNCIFDGGSAGTALGSSVGGQGILASFHDTGGTLELEGCDFIANGHGSSNLYHALYIEPGVDSNVVNCTFTDTYGTGFHSQHFGIEVGAKYINYVNCYFGPFHTALVGAGLSIPAAIPFNVVNCTFEMQDDAIVTGDNGANLKMVNCTFAGASGGNQQIAVVHTGGKFIVENCDFTGTNPSQIFTNADGNLFQLSNNRFSGASTNDVELSTGLTTTEVHAYKNRHTGATVNNYKLASGKRVTVESSLFLGTVSGACVNNLSGSTLNTLNIIDNEFSQSGTSLTLTATPTNLKKQGSLGTIGLGDTFPVQSTLPLVSGRYYGSVIGANSALTALRMYAYPMWLPEPTAIDRIGINVTTGVASSAARCLVYAHNFATGGPGVLLFDPAGNLTTTSATAFEHTVAWTLPRGIVWLALETNAQGTISTNQTHVISLYSQLIGHGSISTNGQGVVTTGAITFGTGPDPFPTYAVSATCPVVRVRVV